MRYLIGLAVLASAVPAAAIAAERPWTLDVSGGLTALGDEGDQPFASIGIRRDFGDMYVRLAGTYIDSDEPDDIGAAFVPAESKQLTLSAGWQLGDLGIDIYGTIGDRDFKSISVQRPGGTQRLTVNTSGDLAALGASLAYDIAAAERWWVTPFVAVDYSQVDTARVVLGPGGSTLRVDESEEDGVTGSGGVTVQRQFGDDARHSVGIYGALVVTSNTSSLVRTSRVGDTTGATRILEGVDNGDTWVEFGVVGSFVLSQSVNLDYSLIRSAGLRPSETTAASLGLRFFF
jgi:outer membrane autotransporter protein